jgi:superoxide reductase
MSTSKMGENIRTANWETEKHVPHIECENAVKRGLPFDVTISLGKNVAHPNTTDHHIRWMSLYFKPHDEETMYQVAHYELCGHGESARGDNEGPVHTAHTVTARVALRSAGTLHSMAHCNIHGLWEDAKEIKLR